MASFTGVRVALGTMHAKDRAIAPPFRRILDASIVVPRAIDTDAFGTFTGEIERKGTMLDAARAKARRAMEITGLSFGAASEGSYGAHPHLPFIPGGTELVLFIDAERGIEVKHSQVVTRTNYDTIALKPDEDIASVLRRMRFPTHAVTVLPNPEAKWRGISSTSSLLPQALPTFPLFKGLTCASEVVDAVRACAEAAHDGRALVVPDMRAHLNPTRMGVIRAAATRLALRIACACPQCALPGFGIVDVARGLPCSDCGAPTALATAEIHRCSGCGFESRKRLRAAGEDAHPGQCALCNP